MALTISEFFVDPEKTSLKRNSSLLQAFVHSEGCFDPKIPLEYIIGLLNADHQATDVYVCNTSLGGYISWMF
jgi:hypothetical protein